MLAQEGRGITITCIFSTWEDAGFGGGGCPAREDIANKNTRDNIQVIGIS